MRRRRIRQSIPDYDVQIVAGKRIVSDKEESREKMSSSGEDNNEGGIVNRKEGDVINKSKKGFRRLLNINKSWLGLESSSSEAEDEKSTETRVRIAETESHEIPLNETFIIRVSEDQRRYFLFPPLTPSSRYPPKLSSANLNRRVRSALVSVSLRSLEVMLRDMRTLDRDRDRFLYGPQIRMFFQKYNVALLDVLDQLLEIYVDPNCNGMSNYEDLLSYLIDTKNARQIYLPSLPGNGFHLGDNSYQRQTSTTDISSIIDRSREDNEFSSSLDGRAYAFADREIAGLLLGLERIIRDSPNFEIPTFQDFLLEKDHYGNGQVSRQHIIRACEVSGLNFGDPYRSKIFRRYLEACDPIGKGRIFSIEKLVDYLNRSLPTQINY